MRVDNMPVEQLETKEAKQTINITHVKQRHSFGYFPSVSEAISFSQFRVAQIILKQADVLVLVEDTHEDLTAENCSAWDIEEADKVFPDKKFPVEYSALNEKQKRFLCVNGGALTLLLLGKISKIYKTYNDGEQAYQMHEAAQKDASILFKPREDLALNLAKQACQHAKKNDVLLVFGQAHDFTSDDPSIKFNTPMDTVAIDLTEKKLWEFRKFFLNIRKEAPNHIMGRVTNAECVFTLGGYKTALIDSVNVLNQSDEEKQSSLMAEFADAICEKAKKISDMSENKLSELANDYFCRANYADALPYYQFLNQHRPTDTYREQINRCEKKLQQPLTRFFAAPQVKTDNAALQTTEHNTNVASLVTVFYV